MPMMGGAAREPGVGETQPFGMGDGRATLQPEASVAPPLAIVHVLAADEAEASTGRSLTGLAGDPRTRWAPPGTAKG